MSTLNAATIKTAAIQHTGGTAALNINSSGYVTRASNIGFKAYSTPGDVAFGNSTTTIVWATTSHNYGNGYSNTTGRFTAPVAGIYHFGYHLYRQTASGYTRMFLDGTGGGANIAYQISPPNTSYAISPNIHGAVYMNANDYVICTLQADSSTNFYFAINHSFFYGFLVG